MLGLASVAWNIANLRATIGERLAEDEYIKLRERPVVDQAVQPK
jgi:hypothetical protein